MLTWHFISKKHIISFALLSLLPLLSIGVGIFLISKGVLFSPSIMITHIAVPVITILLFALVIFLQDSRASKITLSVILTIVFIAVTLFLLLIMPFAAMDVYKNDEVSFSYQEISDSFSAMPELDELGDYNEIIHYDYFSGAMIFYGDADTLTVHYSPEEYEAQKAETINKYVVYDYRNKIFFNKEYCDSTAEIDGYSFSVVSCNNQWGYELQLPKKMMFIATNDEKKTISYTSYYDNDLDYIDNLEEFLLKNCGWKYIIKQN